AVGARPGPRAGRLAPRAGQAPARRGPVPGGAPGAANRAGGAAGQRRGPHPAGRRRPGAREEFLAPELRRFSSFLLREGEPGPGGPLDKRVSWSPPAEEQLRRPRPSPRFLPRKGLTMHPALASVTRPVWPWKRLAAGLAAALLLTPVPA